MDRGGPSLAPDLADFRAWVSPHLLAMTRLAIRLTSDADGDDVVQESLVRAWRRWDSYDDSRGTPLAWLLGVVANQARRHHSRTRAPHHALVDVTERSRDLDREIDVDRAIARLAPRQRLAVELHYYIGLSVTESAAVMGCSDGTVKSTLSDARRRLRTELESA